MVIQVVSAVVSWAFYLIGVDFSNTIFFINYLKGICYSLTNPSVRFVIWSQIDSENLEHLQLFSCICC